MKMTVYNGFVERVLDGVAYTRITREGGPILWLDLPACEDLVENRRFTLTIHRFPDVEVTAEREKEIDDYLRKVLGE